jgi:hypothetical protein
MPTELEDPLAADVEAVQPASRQPAGHTDVKPIALRNADARAVLRQVGELGMR